MTRIMIVPTIVTAQIVIPSVFATVNPDNLTTLDRMRFTAIQMTILSLESEQPTNMSNDEIATQIYKHQQSNKSNDRLTTFEIETLYRNITNGSQVGPDEINGN
jgi:hypothetical protein